MIEVNCFAPVRAHRGRDLDAQQINPVPWGDSVINLNPDVVALGGEDLCAVVFHEMLHWAGEEGSANHNQCEGNGLNDKPYACGRYCGGTAGCNHRGPFDLCGVPVKSSSEDCAACAGTRKEKASCGKQRARVDVPCNPTTLLCHYGLAGDQACATCMGQKRSAL